MPHRGRQQVERDAVEVVHGRAHALRDDLGLDAADEGKERAQRQLEEQDRREHAPDNQGLPVHRLVAGSLPHSGLQSRRARSRYEQHADHGEAGQRQ